jgi:membrane protein
MAMGTTVVRIRIELIFRRCWNPVTLSRVWLGAIITAVLFELGKSAIGFYIGQQGLESTYGAAASIIVVLIWVYYSSQIILMGAEVTHAFAKHRTANQSTDGKKNKKAQIQQ